MGCHLVKTAVLLATYNGSAYLPGLLNSLAGQTDPDFTVLMQDDGSSDSTAELLSAVSGRDSRFVFAAEQENTWAPPATLFPCFARPGRIICS